MNSAIATYYAASTPVRIANPAGAAWRDLATGPGPLWWRMLRWSQRARR